MSAVRSFDSLGYYERLTKAGVPEAQARVQVEVMQGIVHNYDEVSHREFPSKGDLAETRTTLQQEIAAVRTELKQEIAETKHEILKWVVGAALAQTAVIVAIIGVCAAFFLQMH